MKTQAVLEFGIIHPSITCLFMCYDSDVFSFSSVWYILSPLSNTDGYHVRFTGRFEIFTRVGYSVAHRWPIRVLSGYTILQILYERSAYPWHTLVRIKVRWTALFTLMSHTVWHNNTWTNWHCRTSTTPRQKKKVNKNGPKNWWRRRQRNIVDEKQRDWAQVKWSLCVRQVKAAR